MVFLYATTVSPIKLTFYPKNKKVVDLKLQARISRNNSFSVYLSPETYKCNDITLAGVQRCSVKSVFLEISKRLKRDASEGVFP